MKHRTGLMRPRMILLLCFCLILALAMPGCAAAGAGIDLMSRVNAAQWPKSPAEPDAAFTGSVSGFSWRLFQESALNKGNVLVSPASVYLALAMALNGADGDTRSAILHLLAEQGLSETELNEACRDWITLLSNPGGKAQLSISNSIWYRTGFNPDTTFLQKNADFFGAAARALDFSKPESVGVINDWVKQATKDKIEKIIEKIDADVVMYLINAIYFKSDWKTPFLTKETADRAFKTPDKSIQTPFMNRLDSMSYLESKARRGVLLPYADERYAMMVLLPAENEDPRAMIQNMTETDFADLLASGQDVSVELALPKFEARYEDSLLNELDTMGMGIAFDGGRADFSLMNAAHENNLYISEIKHKTYCRVDEKGTEAAAVTSVEIRETAILVADQTMIFDRPFVFGIVDTKTGLPLFLGIMENPAGQSD
ncbi:MAG: serpin family protein [Clostridiaceae bacterium]|nr:serpin family protein [Clostridiaceae bacterium]